VIIENNLYGNGYGGIHTGYGSLINHNTLFMNRGSFSILCWENCVITENVVYGGDDYAIEAGCPSIIIGNVAWSNKLFNYLSGNAPCITVNNSPAP